MRAMNCTSFYYVHASAYMYHAGGVVTWLYISHSRVEVVMTWEVGVHDEFLHSVGDAVKEDILRGRKHGELREEAWRTDTTCQTETLLLVEYPLIKGTLSHRRCHLRRLNEPLPLYTCSILNYFSNS